MCVASPSSHDTTTTREWYEADPDRRQRYYTQVLGGTGPAPPACTPEVMRAIAQQHMDSRAALAVFPIQVSLGERGGGKGGGEKVCLNGTSRGSRRPRLGACHSMPTCLPMRRRPTPARAPGPHGSGELAKPPAGCRGDDQRPQQPPALLVRLSAGEGLAGEGMPWAAHGAAEVTPTPVRRAPPATSLKHAGVCLLQHLHSLPPCPAQHPRRYRMHLSLEELDCVKVRTTLQSLLLSSGRCRVEDLPALLVHGP